MRVLSVTEVLLRMKAEAVLLREEALRKNPNEENALNLQAAKMEYAELRKEFPRLAYDRSRDDQAT